MRIRVPCLVLALAVVSVACGGAGNVFDLTVGDCFQDPGAAEFGAVEIVDCGVAHDYEVFAVYQLTTDDLPGQDVMQAGCEDRFGSVIGADAASAAYSVTLIGPTRQSWDDLGDREVVCVAWSPAGPLTGSLFGPAT